MCGIVGYCGDFDAGTLEAGLAAIAHRGPDGHGTYYDERARIGLGHARLAIIDPAHGAQPMYATDGQVVIVYNGEVYNAPELQAALERQGYAFDGHSDTQVLLSLYLERGTEMLSALNGIFAFAIWDGRYGSLFVARDAFGVKPFYYLQASRGIAFSSEIKGLNAFAPGERQLDLVALDRYLSFLWSPGEATPFQEVRKLLPGHAAVIRDGKFEKSWQWYDLPVDAAPRPMTGQEAVEETAAHLRRAVHRQMLSDVPVGAFLSGGLDSSAVVAFAREVHPAMKCFTIEVDGMRGDGFADDLGYARKVAAHLSVDLEVVKVDADRMAGEIERMVIQLDEPLADPAPLNVLHISQLARDMGIKVLLSGAAGDDLFTGYRRHAALMAEPAWKWLPQPLRAGLEQASQRLDQRNPLFRRAGKLFNGAALDGDASLVNYFRWARPRHLRALYTPQFKAALADADAGQPMFDLLAGIDPAASPLQRMLALEQRFFLIDHNLAYTDKMSMATGVEVRVPFLDLELVEFAACIPDRFKQRGRVGKWVLKKAMEPYLPHDVIYRPKSGFGAPLRQWMRGALRPMLADLLSPDSLRQRGLFTPAAVQQLVADNDAGRVDASYTLFCLLTIEIWCRAYLDRSAAMAGDQQNRATVA